MDFWQIFSKLCDSIGKKPNPVGKQLGIGSATITQWKNGSIPSGEKLVLLADCFNVSVDYLLGRDTSSIDRFVNMSKIPKLFELMNERNINTEKLSADTGISTENISDWKSGRSKPSIEKLKILAEYFNVSTDYLLESGQTLLGNTYEQYSEEDLEIAKLYAALPDNDRRALKEYLKYLTDKNTRQD